MEDLPYRCIKLNGDVKIIKYGKTPDGGTMTLPTLNYTTVQHGGETFYNTGHHVNDESGNRISEWVYIDIQNFTAGVDHVYTWGDKTLTGNNSFGSPKNTNCADLALEIWKN